MHIIGASGHGKVVLDILAFQGLKVTGVWDDGDVKSIGNQPITGSFDAFLECRCSEFILAIGNNVIRKQLALRLDIKCSLTAIHPKCFISESVLIGNGTVVMANATINAYSTIGEHVIVNTNASVDHDCILADFVHISPQVGLAGNVEVGEGTHIGIGASVIQGIKIGKWATIGAGAVIIKNVPDYAVIVGNPGRIINYNNPIHNE